MLGIDEVRRGKSVWRRDPVSRAWGPVVDCWHVGFVDAAAGAGLFGQVEGRTGEAVRAWLQARPAS